MDNNKLKAFMLYPIILAVILIIGIWIGKKLSTQNNSILLGKEFQKNHHVSSGNKVNEVLNFIEQSYVDQIDKDSLTELTLNELLSTLDPHSSYIPAHQMKEVSESLEGNFDGIGIEFNILEDTIIVVSAISGGPSEELGIKSGDRIVKIDGKLVAGIKIKNEDVLKKLRGVKNTMVLVEIRRRTFEKLIPFKIKRDKIPLASVDVSFLSPEKIGYIKLSKFAATTYQEFHDALLQLKKEGMKSLIIDLRGNPGGYLDAATKIADDLLPEGKLIVFTQGKNQPREDFIATSKGAFETQPLVVLIDEGSASASEIIAGAIQDNDRGKIIGRRSFGKGLVQQQAGFADGSALRLTVARYCTPTGRCIQKPYNKGSKAAVEYYDDEIERFKNGELLSVDSIKFDKKQMFKTPKGKIVYGGGGIMPDVFIPIDTSLRSAFISELIYKGIINNYSLTYADRNRKLLLTEFPNASVFLKNYRTNELFLKELLSTAGQQGVKIKGALKPQLLSLLKSQSKALVGRTLYKNIGYYPVVLSADKVMQAAKSELLFEK